MTVRAILIEPRFSNAREVDLSAPLSAYFPYLDIRDPQVSVRFNTDDVLITELQWRRSIHSTPVFRLWLPSRAFTRWFADTGIVVKLKGDRVSDPTFALDEIKSMMQVRMGGRT